MDHCDRRLEWVRRNRAKTDRARPVGGAVERLVGQIGGKGTIAACSAAEAIADAVDDEFRTHCRVFVADGRRLIINVDHAALVYPMRIRWLSPLRKALSRSRLPDAIAFEFGNAGVSVPGAGL